MKLMALFTGELQTLYKIGQSARQRIQLLSLWNTLFYLNNQSTNLRNVKMCFLYLCCIKGHFFSQLYFLRQCRSMLHKEKIPYCKVLNMQVPRDCLCSKRNILFHKKQCPFTTYVLKCVKPQFTVLSKALFFPHPVEIFWNSFIIYDMS